MVMKMNKSVFSGRVAKAVSMANDVAKFTLIRNEYAGKDKTTGEAKDRKVALPFTAFGHDAKALFDFVKKGDQLFVEYRTENNEYVNGEGEKQYGYNFIVMGFEFGAKGPAHQEAN